MSSKSDDNEDLLSDYNESEKSEISKVEDIKSVIKNHLLKTDMGNGKSIFVHLTDCIKRVLEEQPNNATDVFEDISSNIYHDKPPIKPPMDSSFQIGLASIEEKLFEKGEGEEEEGLPEDDIESPLPPLHLMTFFYEQAGIGLSRQEMYRVWMALKVLVNTQKIQKARFWGKILGLEKDYYIAETDLREGEELEEEEEEEAEKEESGDADKEDENEDEEGEEDKFPQSKWKPPPVIPTEDFHTGPNKHLYYVCSVLGAEWKRLPHVTPVQIQAARKLKRFMTGNLDAVVRGGLPFPGLEINLLRAQIARISASTQISPQGFYTFDNEEEEEAEEGVEPEEALENPEYAPLRPRELLEKSSWVHHTKNILPQGRCSWWDPTEVKDDEFEADEEEQDDEEDDGKEAAVRERGPPLLTPISEDVTIYGMAPWTLKICSSRISEYSVSLATSNLWPGASTFSFGKHFENIYVGWGYKAIQKDFNPENPVGILSEFVETKDETEILDPTVEEEAALKAKTAAAEEGEEEMEEEEDN